MLNIARGWEGEMRGEPVMECTYETWYDFKRELQRRSGVTLHNQLWLQIKPPRSSPCRKRS